MQKLQTINQENVMNTISGLPIFRNLNKSDLVVMDQNGNEIKKKSPIGTILSLLVLAGIGYGLVTYVFPILLTVVGYTLGVLASVALVIAAFALFPAYKKWLSIASDKLYRKAIESDPFILLNQKRQEYLKHKETLSRETANILMLQKDSENKAYQSEKEAEQHREEITVYTARANKFKEQIDELIATQGEANAKQDDEFWVLDQKMRININDASRAQSSMVQKMKFVDVYGARGNTFKKLHRTLDQAKMNVDETIKDFDLTITMLQDEYKSAADAKRATQSAKNALGLSSKWEVEFAIQVVNNTIAQNLSQTVANLDDITEMTKNINSNSNPEEQLERLNQLSEKMSHETFFIPTAKKFKNVDHKFTQEEKHNAGSFGGLLK